MKPDVGNSVDYSERPPAPEGTYECTILKYEYVDNPFFKAEPWTSDKAQTVNGKSYQPGEVIPADPEWKRKQYQWVFEVAEGPDAGRWFFARTGTMLTKNERNKLYKLFSKVYDVELLDGLIDNGDAPDMDDEIVGQPIKVVVEVVKSKKTGKPTNKVNSFMKSDKEPDIKF